MQVIFQSWIYFFRSSLTVLRPIRMVQRLICRLQTSTLAIGIRELLIHLKRLRSKTNNVVFLYTQIMHPSKLRSYGTFLSHWADHTTCSIGQRWATGPHVVRTLILQPLAPFFYLYTVHGMTHADNQGHMDRCIHGVLKYYQNKIILQTKEGKVLFYFIYFVWARSCILANIDWDISSSAHRNAPWPPRKA